MQFKDVIGQEAVKDKLLNVVQNNRISHAYLFTGDTGIGKLALAISFAQYIMCTDKRNGDSCGKCPSCKKYAKLEHPDLHFVFPVVKKDGGSKSVVSDDFIANWRDKVLSSPYFDLNDWYAYIGAEKKSGMIYESESVSILKKLSIKSFESDYKIMLIWHPELMNIACSNKILKLVEEPPEKTIFLMVSDKPQEILSTIYSRTQKIEVPSLSDTVLTQSLQSIYNIDEAKALEYTRLSAGSWLTAAKQVNTTVENEYNFETFISLMRTCWSRKVLDLISWSKEISLIGRERQKSFLSYSIRMIRESFINNLGKSEIVYANSDEKEFMSRFSPYINEDNVITLYSELNRAHSDIARNGNAKIIFLDLSLKLVKVIRPQ